MSATVQLRFPPLRSVVELDGAPPEVHDLLVRRWLAESPADGALPPSFSIGWRIEQRVGAPAHEPAWAVRWQPTGDSGQLHNDTGRVLLYPDRARSRIEALPDFALRPAGLEALLEAALGHALAASGECFLHAAAFELGGRTPLVIGESGSGKSTLTAAALALGGRAVSDDSLLLGLTGGRPVVRTARKDLWLRSGSEALVPALERRGLSHGQATEGRTRFSRDSCPGAFAISARPDCLVVLLGHEAVGSGLGARRLSQAEALAALLRGTSALYVTDARFEDRQRLLLDLMTAFAQELPAVELRTTPSLLDATEESLAAIVAGLP